MAALSEQLAIGQFRVATLRHPAMAEALEGQLVPEASGSDEVLDLVAEEAEIALLSRPGQWALRPAVDPVAHQHQPGDALRFQRVYPTMPTDEICALKVPAAPDAALFLWATVPMLEHGLQVLRAWGFAYRSNLVWNKPRIGTGYWARNKHEHLLIGTRGDVPAPAPGSQPDSVIDGAVTRHSAKPIDFAEAIERIFPTAPKIELFARSPRRGWDVWGNESTGSAA